MANFNNRTIKKLDQSQMLLSIHWLFKQCEQVWEDRTHIEIPASYKDIDSVFVSGMGGSALGAHIIRSLYEDTIQIPFVISNSYTIPAHVNSKTLFLASSYSGNTEEILHATQLALKQKAKVMVWTSGGKLAEIKEKYGLPGYVFDPRYNPSNQPRIGLGYSIFGQWALLDTLGIVTLSPQQARSVIQYAEETSASFGAKSPSKNNEAKKMAQKIFGKIPIIVTSEFLEGNAHTFANQINENAKTFSSYFLISEMNHHLIEGFSFPRANSKNLHFIFFDSKFFHPQNRKRFAVTQKILAKNKISYSQYRCTAPDKILQSFEMLLLGSYTSFYLAMLNNLDPSPIPYVDFLKNELANK